MVRVDTRAVGERGEQIALRYLEGRGLRTVDRNFRCRLGEIDLIMLDGDCLVFVEVRYRSGKRIAPAVLTVDRFKQQKKQISFYSPLMVKQDGKQRINPCWHNFPIQLKFSLSIKST